MKTSQGAVLEQMTIYSEIPNQPINLAARAQDNLKTIFQQNKCHSSQVRNFMALLQVRINSNFQNYSELLNYIEVNDPRGLLGKLEKSLAVKQYVNSLINDVVNPVRIRAQSFLQTLINERLLTKEMAAALIRKKSILGFQEIDSNLDMRQSDKYRIFNSLLNDKADFYNYIRPRPLKHLLKESIEQLLRAYLVDADHFYIDNILKDVFQNKDYNLTAVEHHKNLTMSATNKANLIKAIKELPLFKEFEARDGEDLQLCQFDMMEKLFRLLTFTYVLYPSETVFKKYEIIQAFVNNPTYNLNERNDYAQTIEKIMLAVETQPSVENFLKIKQTTKKLADRKKADIENILQIASKDMSESDSKLLTNLLNAFKFQEFYNNKLINHKFKEIYEFVHQKSVNLVQAYNRCDEDLNEIKKNLEKFLLREFKGKKVVESQRQVIFKEIIENCNLEIIEDNDELGHNVKYSLLLSIQSNELFIKYKKIKLPEVTIKDKLRTELWNFFVEADLQMKDNYTVIRELVENLIKYRRNTELQNNLAITPQIQRNLLKKMKDPKECALFKEYQMYGVDIELEQNRCQNSLYTHIIRKLNVNYRVYKGLLKTIFQNRNFACIRKEIKLTEEQKKSIIEFTSTNKDCQNYAKACETRRLIDIELRLKMTAVDIFLENKLEEELVELVLLFVKLDKGLKDMPHEFFAKKIQNLVVSTNFIKAYARLENNNDFLQYTQRYKDIIENKRRRYLDEFKRDLEMVLEKNDVDSSKVERLLRQLLTDNGIQLKVLVESPILQRRGKVIYNEIREKESCQNLEMIFYVFQVRSNLIFELEFINQFSELIRSDELQIKQGEGEAITNSLKKWDLRKALTKNPKLTLEKQAIIIQNIVSKGTFTKFITALGTDNIKPDQINFISQLNIFCSQNAIEFDRQLLKFIQTKVKISIEQQEPLVFETARKLEDLAQVIESYGKSVVLTYKNEVLKSTQFDRLKYSEQHLDLRVKKLVKVDIDGETVEFICNRDEPINKIIESQDIRLKNKYYRLEAGNQIVQTETFDSLKQVSEIKVVILKKLTIKSDVLQQLWVEGTKTLFAIVKAHFVGRQILSIKKGNIELQDLTMNKLCGNLNEAEIEVKFKQNITLEGELKKLYGPNYQQVRRSFKIFESQEARALKSKQGVVDNFTAVYQGELEASRKEASKRLIEKLEGQGDNELYLRYKDNQYYKHLIFNADQASFSRDSSKVGIKASGQKNIINELTELAKEEYGRLKQLLLEAKRLRN